jgi:hypothetical protein
VIGQLSLWEVEIFTETMKSSKNKELLEELTSVMSGKTLDAIFPPLLFVLLNNLLSLNVAIIGALGVATILGIYRISKKQKIFYAITGWLGVAMAGGFAFLANNATNFFLPGIISNVVFITAIFISIVIGRPIAALASHLTRGWSLQWFWRDDIKPAYREVTWMWLMLILIRTLLQIYLYIQESVVELAWVNFLLGIPFTIFILLLSYIYGLWRLKQLKGPGIEEYMAQKQPPYKGQTRGF